jgi:hypothetical protein
VVINRYYFAINLYLSNHCIQFLIVSVIARFMISTPMKECCLLFALSIAKIEERTLED